MNKAQALKRAIEVLGPKAVVHSIPKAAIKRLGSDARQIVKPFEVGHVVESIFTYVSIDGTGDSWEEALQSATHSTTAKAFAEERLNDFIQKELRKGRTKDQVVGDALVEFPSADVQKIKHAAEYFRRTMGKPARRA
jgi:hypothetical protein